ncbi:hypothetical protein [Methylocella tundrae]|nr:hypothetical protein SIN04_11345 [Methylocella tundrae]
MSLKELSSALTMYVATSRDPINGKHEIISEQENNDALKHCRALRESCIILGANITRIAVDRMIVRLEPGPVSIRDLNKLIDDITGRLEDEFFSINLLVLEQTTQTYFGSDGGLFGPDVSANFPALTEDIAEAGNCLALSRHTAAVFHLMRVMEVGVQRLGDLLHISLPSTKNWQNILDEVNKAIKALPPKERLTKQYAESAAHLYNVKLGWRNEVMHPKQTYTEEEAVNVFNACRAFMRDLAGLVSETAS